MKIASDIIVRYFTLSRITYAPLYMQLYVAFNAWYRQETKAVSDRQALSMIKSRRDVWLHPRVRRIAPLLEPYIDRIIELTDKHPIYGPGWSGSLENYDDWSGLVEYWYRVRCELFHGMLHEDIRHHRQYVQLAYITLSLYLQTVVDELQQPVKPTKRANRACLKGVELTTHQLHRLETEGTMTADSQNTTLLTNIKTV